MSASWSDPAPYTAGELDGLPAARDDWQEGALLGGVAWALLFQFGAIILLGALVLLAVLFGHVL